MIYLIISSIYPQHDRNKSSTLYNQYSPQHDILNHRFATSSNYSQPLISVYVRPLRTFHLVFNKCSTVPQQFFFISSLPPHLSTLSSTHPRHTIIIISSIYPQCILLYILDNSQSPRSRSFKTPSMYIQHVIDMAMLSPNISSATPDFIPHLFLSTSSTYPHNIFII